MTGLHWGKQGAQHPETDSSVEGVVMERLQMTKPIDESHHLSRQRPQTYDPSLAYR